MRRADQIAAIVLLVFSAAVMEGSRRMPESMTFGPGAGFLPFWLGVAMAILSILMLVNATREPAGAGGKSPFPGGAALLRIAATAASLAVYIVSLETLGFLLATALLSAFLLGVIERERLAVTAVVALANAGALYFIFQRLLGVTLPKNTLGF
jgi:putative tricarboxylic transport membrane protein